MRKPNPEVDPVTGQVRDDVLREDLERAMCTLADHGHLLQTRREGSVSDAIDALRVLVDGKEE